MLLISDLHLQPEREDITRSLVDFLNGRARDHRALYILGDLFEVWIGDDNPSPLGNLVATELSRLAQCGVEIFLMHGNRDFLIGQDFADRCHATLLPEPCILDAGFGPLALMHGDTLCTGDTQYMMFRKQVRNTAWQQAFLAKSLEERAAFARQARDESQQATRNTAAAIMDVHQQTVKDVFEELQITTLIHGHTHRPAVHDVAFSNPIHNQSQGTRLVLGDWDRCGWYADLTTRSVTLHQFPLLQN